MLGSDESLGGALLSPIPWLRNNGTDGEVRTESTSYINGPNGAGSVETVSLSTNGTSSPLPDTGAVTQGELLRQEQEAGIVPVSQTISSRQRGSTAAAIRAVAEGEGDFDEIEDVEDADRPHARGPEIVGAEDVGPQRTSGGIDMEAAMGRGSSPQPPHGTVRPMPDNVGDETKQVGAEKDVILTDADGKTEEDKSEDKPDESGENVGADAMR